MKNLKIIINSNLEPGETPGQFIELNLTAPDSMTDLELDFAVYQRLRYSVVGETLIGGEGENS